ncbi:MAG TPA: hypothetical protein VMH30_07235 [Verrucomicrobiae bacterium]|nr:hypothetical protein [Verrucomicrobiae bacterium]
MQNDLDYLAMLQWEVQEKYKCTAVHRESVDVDEVFDGDAIWEGRVEIFDLAGHAEAKTCYAWAYLEKDKEWAARFITVLGSRVMDSPQKAVRAAIFYDAQSAPMRYAGPRANAA